MEGVSELIDLSFLARGIEEDVCFASDSLRVLLELRLGEAEERVRGEGSNRGWRERGSPSRALSLVRVSSSNTFLSSQTLMIRPTDFIRLSSLNLETLAFTQHTSLRY